MTVLSKDNLVSQLSEALAGYRLGGDDNVCRVLGIKIVDPFHESVTVRNAGHGMECIVPRYKDSSDLTNPSYNVNWYGKVDRREEGGGWLYQIKPPAVLVVEETYWVALVSSLEILSRSYEIYVCASAVDYYRAIKELITADFQSRKVPDSPTRASPQLRLDFSGQYSLF